MSNYMKKLIYAFCTGLLFSTQIWAVEIPKPGFDCTKASTKTEEAICSSKKLSILDRDMSSLYKSLRKIKYPKIRSNQIAWIEERNKCDTSPEINNCLLGSYHNRVLELVSLHIEASKFGSYYCYEKCLYPGIFTVEDLRVGDNKIELLILTGRYSFGVVSTGYSIRVYDDNRIEFKENICQKQVEDDGRGKIHGDKNCSLEYAKSKFSSGI